MELRSERGYQEWRASYDSVVRRNDEVAEAWEVAVWEAATASVSALWVSIGRLVPALSKTSDARFQLASCRENTLYRSRSR